MNKKQAVTMSNALKKVIRKKCGVCRETREFQIINEITDGASKWFVKVHCRCESIVYSQFKSK